MRNAELVGLDKKPTYLNKLMSRIVILLLALNIVIASSAIAQAQISSCAYGEPIEFDNSGLLTFTADPNNSQLFTAQSIQNGTIFDIEILDNSSPDHPLLLPISGTGHSQSGGNATGGAVRLLGPARVVVTATASITIKISGDILVTEIEFYAHDIEDTEVAIFGTQDYVAGSLAAHPGATINVDEATITLSGAAGNTNGQSNRSGLALYQNDNGLTTLTQDNGVVSARIGTGWALGTYCVSIVETIPENFPEITGAGEITASVVTSDTLNGVRVDFESIIFTPGDVTGPDGNPSTAITLNNDGTVTIPAGTQPGDYTVKYQICDKINPTNCSTAVETITVTANPSLSMTKVADSTGPHLIGDVVTYTYTITNDGDLNVRNIAITDTHNGSDPAPVPGNETLLTDVAPTGDSTDAAVDGSWDVLAPGDTLTFTGTYTVTDIDAASL